MDYIFFIGLVMPLLLPCTLLNIILDVTIVLIEKFIDRRGTLFYFGRLVRAYFYSSLFLTFSSFYISSGLSFFGIISISYFAIMFCWMMETKTGKEKYYEEIEFKLAADKYKIICLIYSSVFFLMYFLNLPKEPLLSGLIFKSTLWFMKYKIFTILVFLGGFGIIFNYGLKLISVLRNKTYK